MFEQRSDEKIYEHLKLLLQAPFAVQNYHFVHSCKSTCPFNLANNDSNEIDFFYVGLSRTDAVQLPKSPSMQIVQSGTGRQLLFNRYRTTQLPTPYVTMCNNYSISQHYCNTDCIQNHYRAKYASIPKGSLVEIDKDSNLSFTAVYDHEIYLKCAVQCKRPACQSTAFICEGLYDSGMQRHISITLADTTTRTSIHAKLTFSERVLQVVSVLSIWLGLALFDATKVLEVLRRLCARLFEKPAVIIGQTSNAAQNSKQLHRTPRQAWQEYGNSCATYKPYPKLHKLLTAK